MENQTVQEIIDLVDTFLADEHAVGLAAPQIGIRKRIFVFDPKYPASVKKTKESTLILINPKTSPSRKDMSWITQVKEDELYWDGEGCLSLPKIATRVPRLKSIKLKGFDVSGKKISKKFDGYAAKIIQHEMDHLFGRVIIDYGQEIYATETKVPYIKG